MEHTEYRAQWDILLSAYRLLEAVELDAIAETIERADSFGPMLDPTAYRAGAHRLPPQREMVRAAIAFRNTVRKFDPYRQAAGWPVTRTASS